MINEILEMITSKREKYYVVLLKIDLEIWKDKSRFQIPLKLSKLILWKKLIQNNINL